MGKRFEITLENDAWFFGFKYPQQYFICERTNDPMGPNKQEISIPENVFRDLLVKVIRCDKTLLTKLLETAADEIRNPTVICPRCEHNIPVKQNPCQICLNRGYI